MDVIVEKLKKFSSPTPSKWREEAEWRRANRSWLHQSQMVAIKMHGKMREQGITQKELAERLGCTQQYVSKMLKGTENLSLEMLCNIEDVLQIQLLSASSYADAECECV